MTRPPIQHYDIAIVGAGMAGASVAAECAPHARVLLLEAEDAPGYHTTGRSAAFWEECYGGPELVPLTRASGSYLREHGFLAPRGALYIGRREDGRRIDAFMDRFGPTGATVERLNAADVRARLPHVREPWVDGVLQPNCSDIDVAALHQHYLAAARRADASLAVRTRVEQVSRADDRWIVRARDGRAWSARTLVNAAGAWADEIARLSGARPLGIQPLRRTVAQVATDPAPPPDLPLVLDISGTFYFKPEGDRLWLSPHDEVPSAPCDAAADEVSVAEAIARYEAVVAARVTRVERKWAGLRSFAPDRLPVYGFDTRQPGFFWFAGQGGYGIQTAPAAARLASQLLLGRPRDAMTLGLDADLYDPGRLG